MAITEGTKSCQGLLIGVMVIGVLLLVTLVGIAVLAVIVFINYRKKNLSGRGR